MGIDRNRVPFRAGGNLPSRPGISSHGGTSERLPALASHVHDGTLIEQAIFTLIGANMNSTADQAFTKLVAYTNFQLTRVIVNNASISLATAAGGIYTAAAKGGSAIVAASQVYSALTLSTKFINPALAGTALTDILTVTPILSLTTAQGAAATADIRIMGIPLS